MERGIFDQWFDENIDSWITTQVENSEPISEVDFSDNGDFFREVAFGVDAFQLFLADHDYRLTLSSLYGLLGTGIEFALDSGWLEQEDHWAKIMDLFYTRSNEFVGDPQVFILQNTDLPNHRAIKIIEYIVHNFVLKSELYSSDEFTVDEKVQLIRSTLIGMRNNKFIPNSSLLSRFFATLATDWRVLGGGFGGGMGSGSNPWSHGG